MLQAGTSSDAQRHSCPLAFLSSDLLSQGPRVFLLDSGGFTGVPGPCPQTLREVGFPPTALQKSQTQGAQRSPADHAHVTWSPPPPSPRAAPLSHSWKLNRRGQAGCRLQVPLLCSLPWDQRGPCGEPPGLGPEGQTLVPVRRGEGHPPERTLGSTRALIWAPRMPAR